MPHEDLPAGTGYLIRVLSLPFFVSEPMTTTRSPLVSLVNRTIERLPLSFVTLAVQPSAGEIWSILTFPSTSWNLTSPDSSVSTSFS